jgi:tRNA threonylcarbamoyl adenosine modification protein YeaZ
VIKTSETILSIDLSSSPGSVCVHREQNGKRVLISEVWLAEPLKHSEALLGAVHGALQGQGLGEVSRFVTASGPGSFTGLRVAYACLKAFCLATGSPLETVDGHEARALAYYDLNPLPAELTIATQMTREAFWVSEFVRQPHQTVERKADEKREALLETAGLLLTDKEYAQGECFPLKARYLAEVFERCSTRKSFLTEAELAASTPLYFGSRPYG